MITKKEDFKSVNLVRFDLNGDKVFATAYMVDGGYYDLESIDKENPYGAKFAVPLCWKFADEVKTETPEEKEALDAIERVGWKNGDSCRYANDISHEYIYIGEHPHGDGHYVFSEDKGITYIANGYLLEPETPEAKKEREREEKKAIDVNAMCLSVTSLKLSQAVALYEAGYRKGE